MRDKRAKRHPGRHLLIMTQRPPPPRDPTTQTPYKERIGVDFNDEVLAKDVPAG